MKRLFVAASLEPETVLQLLNLQQLLAEHALDLRLIPEERFHLTLRFLGTASEDQARAVRDLLDQLPLPTAPDAGFRLTGMDAFPGREGLTVFAGLVPSPGLLALQSSLETGLQGLGFPVEPRSFVPHITLARKVRLRTPLQPGAQRLGKLQRPEALLLYESRLDQGGPSYLPLLTRPFKPA